MPMNNPSAVSGAWTAANRWGIPAVLRKPQAQMASPPTVSTSTSGSTIASRREYSISSTGDASFPYASASANSTVNLAAGIQVYNPVTTNAAGTAFQNQSCRYLIDFEGTDIEFVNQSSGGAYWIKINDEYIDPVGVTLSADAVVRNIKVTFSARTACRIEFISYFLGLSKVNVDITAGIAPAPIRGPRMIVVGDSFNGTPTSYPRVIADMFGFDDVWNSGVGGTGVVATNSGASQSFEQRFAHDVLAFRPTICWVVGSVNDNSSTPALVSAALFRMRAAFLAAVPNGLFMWSPNVSNGASWTAINQTNIRDTVKAAFSGLAQTAIPDPTCMPISTLDTVPSGTLYASPSIGAGTLQIYGQQNIGGYPQPGGIIKIDDEYLECKTSAFGGSISGRYVFNVTLDGVTKQAHAAGAAWTQVGSSYISGGGSVANPSGYGSSDVYRISAADIHPTFAGQLAFGKALANQAQRAIYP